MRHLFILDPPDKETLAINSTLKIAQALYRRGHEIYFADTPDLTTVSGQGSYCRGQQVTFSQQATVNYLAEKQDYPLASFSAIHMRKDPPFDLAYLAATWQLDHPLVFNSPQALRQFNEKMAVLSFPDQTVKSLVSRDWQLILDFIAGQLAGDAIIKPLTMFGGAGVFRLNKVSAVSARKQLQLAIADHNTPLIVQQFMPQVFTGEVRSFCAFGQPVAWCLKVPAKGQFLANTARGAILKDYHPSTEEIATVTAVAQRLLKEGVYLVGFDMIAGLITEINITSPRLLLPPDNKADPYETIAQLLVEKVDRLKQKDQRRWK